MRRCSTSGVEQSVDTKASNGNAGTRNTNLASAVSLSRSVPLVLSLATVVLFSESSVSGLQRSIFHCPRLAMRDDDDVWMAFRVGEVNWRKSVRDSFGREREEGRKGQGFTYFFTGILPVLSTCRQSLVYAFWRNMIAGPLSWVKLYAIRISSSHQSCNEGKEGNGRGRGGSVRAPG